MELSHSRSSSNSSSGSGANTTTPASPAPTTSISSSPPSLTVSPPTTTHTVPLTPPPLPSTPSPTMTPILSLPDTTEPLSAELLSLFKYYSSNDQLPQSHLDDFELRIFQDRCNSLFSKDYRVALVDNSLCPTYPLQFIFVQRNISLFVNDVDPATVTTAEQRAEMLGRQMLLSCNCRTRQRFPVPVLQLQGRNICRSAGLAEKPELMMRKFRKRKTIGEMMKKGFLASKRESHANDQKWLQMLRVHHVFDLMNERTRTLLGLPLASGELASKYYQTFAISSMPFPGVSAYADFRQERQLKLPLPGSRLGDESKKQKPSLLSLAVDYSLPGNYKWANFSRWNVVTTLQNYLHYTFHILRTTPTTEGILVHCISGWDRTPMFISVLRILLWAEGEAHQSLSATQLLYLTLAYDWMLFGHQLLHRLSEHSEILYFSFWALQHLTSSQYSFNFSSSSPSSSSSSPSITRKRRSAPGSRSSSPSRPTSDAPFQRTKHQSTPRPSPRHRTSAVNKNLGNQQTQPRPFLSTPTRPKALKNRSQSAPPMRLSLELTREQEQEVNFESNDATRGESSQIDSDAAPSGGVMGRRQSEGGDLRQFKKGGRKSAERRKLEIAMRSEGRNNRKVEVDSETENEHEHKNELERKSEHRKEASSVVQAKAELSTSPAPPKSSHRDLSTSGPIATAGESSSDETKNEKKRSSSVSFSVPIITISPAIVDDLLLPTPSPFPSPPLERDRSPKRDGQAKRSPPRSSLREKERAKERERERERERRATSAAEKMRREEAKELRVKRLLEVWELFRVRYLSVIAPVMK